MSVSEPTCRICMAGETKEDFFISPCLCKGSTKYTHISCLKEWILIKNKKVKDSL